MPRNGRRQDIEGLRGVAVLIVLLFHAGFSWFRGGFIGVDVFFVVSGFVITAMVQREIETTRSISFSRFYAGRARRLLPALLLTIAATFAAGFLIFTPAHFHDLSVSILYAIAGLPNFYFWQQSGYFDITSEFRPLLHTWSLGVEQQFYLVWPTFLLLAMKVRRPFFTPVLVGVMALISLGVSKAYQADSQAIFFLPWFRAFEFSIGAGTYWLLGKQPKGSTADAVGIVGVALLCYALLRFDERTVFPSTNALLPCFGAAMIIIAGSQSWIGQVLSNHLVSGVGALSYSLYLVHWPLLVFWRYVKFTDLDDLDRLLIILVAFVLAWLMYRFVEMPIHKGERAKRFSSKKVGMFSFAALAAVAVIAFLPWSNSGWEFRVGDAAAKYPELAAIGEVSFRKTQYGGAGTTPVFQKGPRPASILIAGDSHSRQYFAGLSTVYNVANVGIQVIDEGSCIFRVRRCPDFDATVRGFVTQKHEALLFISQRWDFDKHVSTHFGKAVVAVPAEVLAEFYANRIAALFDIYALSHDQKIFVMGATPEVSTFGDVGTCLLRPRFFAAARNCETSTVQEPSIAFRRRFNRLLSARIAALNDLHGWSIIFGDPFAALCNSEVCEQAGADGILYNDHDHLSIAGSKRVISAFSEELGTLLRTP